MPDENTSEASAAANTCCVPPTRPKAATDTVRSEYYNVPTRPFCPSRIVHWSKFFTEPTESAEKLTRSASTSVYDNQDLSAHHLPSSRRSKSLDELHVPEEKTYTSPSTLPSSPEEKTDTPQDTLPPSLNTRAEAEISALDQILDSYDMDDVTPSFDEPAEETSLDASANETVEITPPAELDQLMTSLPEDDLKRSASLDKLRLIDNAPPEDTSDTPSGALKASAEAVRGLLASLPQAPNQPAGEALYDVPPSAATWQVLDTGDYGVLVPGAVLLKAPARSRVIPDNDYVPMAPAGQLSSAQSASEYEKMAPRTMSPPAADKAGRLAQVKEEMAPVRQRSNAITCRNDLHVDYEEMASIRERSKDIHADNEEMAAVGERSNIVTSGTDLHADYEEMAPVRERSNAITSCKDLDVEAPRKQPKPLQVADDYEVMAPRKQKVIESAVDQKPVNDYEAMAPRTNQVTSLSSRTKPAEIAADYEVMAPRKLPETSKVAAAFESRASHKRKVPDDYEVMVPSKIIMSSPERTPVQVADDYEVMAPRNQPETSQGDYQVMSSVGVPKEHWYKKQPVTPPRPPKPGLSFHAADTDVYEEMSRPKAVYENAAAMNTVYVNLQKSPSPPPLPPKPRPSWRSPDTDVYEEMSLKPAIPVKKKVRMEHTYSNDGFKPPVYSNEEVEDTAEQKGHAAEEPIYALYDHLPQPSQSTQAVKELRTEYKKRAKTLLPGVFNSRAGHQHMHGTAPQKSSEATALANPAERKARSVTFAPKAMKGSKVDKVPKLARKEESGLLGRLRSLTRREGELAAPPPKIVHTSYEEAGGRSDDDVPRAGELQIVHTTFEEAGGRSEDDIYESLDTFVPGTGQIQTAPSPPRRPRRVGKLPSPPKPELPGIRIAREEERRRAEEEKRLGTTGSQRKRTGQHALHQPEAAKEDLEQKSKAEERKDADKESEDSNGKQ